MEHLDLYVSGKTRVYFYAMHFEGKPLLLILIAFCFLEFSVTLFQKHNRFPQNKLLWQQSFNLISLLVFSRVSVDCSESKEMFTAWDWGMFPFSDCSAKHLPIWQPWHCLHSQYFSYCPKAWSEMRTKARGSFSLPVWRSFAEHLLGLVVSCWAEERVLPLCKSEVHLWGRGGGKLGAELE